MLSGMLLLTDVTAFCKGNPRITGESNKSSEALKDTNEMKGDRIRISIGAKTFTATLADNPTATAFKALLPLNLKMGDLHGNEKFFHLPSPLPSNDENPGAIQTGDLMLWSSKSVVLFYQSFPTSYQYTKMGVVDNPIGLSAALGAGEVTLRFELE